MLVSVAVPELGTCCDVESSICEMNAKLKTTPSPIGEGKLLYTSPIS